MLMYSPPDHEVPGTRPTSDAQLLSSQRLLSLQKIIENLAISNAKTLRKYKV